MLHNENMLHEYMEGEEGVDYVKPLPGLDPHSVNEKKLEQEIKSKIALVAIDEPLIAEEMTKKIFSTDSDLDHVFAEGDIPFDEVKFYPGSTKGLEPEDDPEAYSKWFFEN